jgi:serine/threonine-protein kinase
MSEPSDSPPLVATSPPPDEGTERAGRSGDSALSGDSREEAPAAADGGAAPPAFAGRYELGAEVGRGGMGVVLRALDPVLGRELAVKILLPEHVGRPVLERRFLAEARIAARLQHPGVPPVHEVGRLPDGRPYIAMRLVRGRTLAELLAGRAGPAAGLDRLFHVFEQVCQTVAYAHSRGVVHRDLKPANVMVGEFGEVQVMDWGLAKVVGNEGGGPPPYDAGDAERTRPGVVVGTPAYMAPEQARGEVESVDARCDVFGLGAILCAILTGRPPFVSLGDSDASEQARKGALTEAYARLDRCGAEADLVALAKACLSANPSCRPSNAGVVALVLAAHLADAHARLREAEVARVKSAARRRLRWVLAGTGAAAALGLMALAAFAWNAARQREEASRAVDADLAEAARLEAEAKWPEALALVERAEGRLAAAGSDELARRVRQARADREAVARLDEIRLTEVEIKDGAFDRGRAAPAYAAAFRRYGIDVEALAPAEAAERVRASAVRPQLTAALDDWAAADAGDGRDRLFAVARLVDDDAWRGRFRDALRRGDGQELERLAARADAADLPPGDAARLGGALARDGRTAVAVETLRAAQRRRPDDFWITLELGSALCQARPPRADEAVGYFRAAVALRPNSAGAYVNLGCALLLLGRPADAEAAFRDAVRLQPDCPQARHDLGCALAQQGKHGEAADAQREALRLKPDYAEAAFSLGCALTAAGDPDGALDALRVAVRLRPGYAEAHCNLGGLLYGRGRRDEAEAEYWAAVAADGRLPLPHYNLANLLAERGRLADAEAEYRAALKAFPDYPEANCNLGQLLVRQGRFAEALPFLRRGHETGSRDPRWPYPSADWVKNAERLAALDDKLSAVLRGVAKPADPAEALQLAGLASQYKRNPGAAASLYAAAFDADPFLADEFRAGRRFQAAAAAALAGCGRGDEAFRLSDADRARWRRQALDWLRADLAQWKRLADGDDPEGRAAVPAALDRWGQDPDLSGLRDPEALARLPDAERDAWRAFWADVAALRARGDR